MNSSALKPFDIQGAYPKEVNTTTATALGWGIQRMTQAKRVLVGMDGRPSSFKMVEPLVEALAASGIEVHQMGECDTAHWVYHMNTYEPEGHQMDFGVMVTAGHGGFDDGGFKFLGLDGRPLAPEDTAVLYALMQEAQPYPLPVPEVVRHVPDPAAKHRAFLVSVLEGYGGWPVEPDQQPMTVVIDGGGFHQSKHEYQKIVEDLDLGGKVHYENLKYDDVYTNPLDPARQLKMSEAILHHKANLGLAWSADGSRLVAYDEQGRCLHGAYLGAYLATIVSQRYPTDGLLVDQRCVFPMLNTALHGKNPFGIAMAGTSYMRSAMRQSMASFGAEMSGGYYFKEFFWAENSMLAAWLLTHMVYLSPKPLGEIVDAMTSHYPATDEMTLEVQNAPVIIEGLKTALEQIVTLTEVSGELVGRSKDKHHDWRFCLRVAYNTGRLGLTLESRGTTDQLHEVRDLLLTMVDAFANYDKKETV